MGEVLQMKYGERALKINWFCAGALAQTEDSDKIFSISVCFVIIMIVNGVIELLRLSDCALI